MTTACWPAVFWAMESGGFSTIAIQNSVRELKSLDDVLERRPTLRNYYTGFGMIEFGHTGSTCKGLWVAGVLQALQHPMRFPFGAGADAQESAGTGVTVRVGLHRGTGDEGVTTTLPPGPGVSPLLLPVRGQA